MPPWNELDLSNRSFHHLLLLLKGTYYSERFKELFQFYILNPKESKRLAFCETSLSLSKPMKIYHWKLLPQVMSNILTLCPKLVTITLQRARELFPLTFIIHYVDDTLLSAVNNRMLEDLFAEIKDELTYYGLLITPEWIQCTSSICIYGSW